MRIDKNYRLYSIELQYGKRYLEYNSVLWIATYRYNLKEKQVSITPERFWKVLEKYHKIDDYILPTIHSENNLTEKLRGVFANA